MKKRSRGTLRDWLIILASLLDDVLLLALVLLVLWYFGIPVTIPVLTVVLPLIIAFTIIMHKKVIPALHLKKVSGGEGMIGLEAAVVKALRPEGTVKVKGEYWTARSAGGNIAAGERVEITALKDLTLEVRRKAG